MHEVEGLEAGVSVVSRGVGVGGPVVLGDPGVEVGQVHHLQT